jgi:hypothetical protein
MKMTLLIVSMLLAASTAFADDAAKKMGHDKEHAHVTTDKVDHEHDEAHHKDHDHKAHHPEHKKEEKKK